MQICMEEMAVEVYAETLPNLCLLKEDNWRTLQRLQGMVLSRQLREILDLGRTVDVLSCAPVVHR